jgi:N-acetylglucosamine-6-phosphate deacetylase
MKYYIKADCFLLENKVESVGYLLVEKGRFGSFVKNVPVGVAVADWSGYTIAPGLFDTHIHGIKGHDVMDGTTNAVQGISEAILPLGVTRFLPTTLTSSDVDLKNAIKAITKAVNNGLLGAKFEGIFLEGPYFTEKHKGAQNPIHFRDPSYDEFQEWQQLADNTIVKIALAPERDSALEFIRLVSNEGIQVSIAHTDASYDRCQEAVDAGVSNFVHLFNGMSGLHHREPGVVGAALGVQSVYAELICDGYHVHPDVATLALRVKGDKLVLISDCMRAGLMADGDYMLGEYKVIMKGGIARTATGSLAGSTLTLINAVKNLRAWSKQSLHEVWRLGSLSPAKSIGRDADLGSISTGKLADYVVLDNELVVQAVAVEGEIKYRKA